jgi:hypothetical protein
MRGLCSSATTLEDGDCLIEAVGDPACERQQAGGVEDYILREDGVEFGEVLGVEEVSSFMAGLRKSFDG